MPVSANGHPINPAPQLKPDTAVLPITHFKTSEIRRVMFESYTEDEWNLVKQSLLQRCVAGSEKAMRILLEYSVGKPVTPVDLTVTQTPTIETSVILAKVSEFLGNISPTKIAPVEETPVPIKESKVKKPKKSKAKVKPTDIPAVDKTEEV